MKAYAIYDRTNGFLILHTVASNRKAAWDKFCEPENRRWFKKCHFYCVPVEIHVAEYPKDGY